MKKIVSMLLVSAMTLVYVSSLQCFAHENKVHNEVISVALAEEQDKVSNEANQNPEVVIVSENPNSKSAKENPGVLKKVLGYISDNKWWFIIPAVVGSTQALILASDKYLSRPARAVLKTVNLSNEAMGKYVKIMQDICKDPVKRGRFEDFSTFISKIPGLKNYILALYPAYDSFRDKPDKYLKTLSVGAAAGATVGGKIGAIAGPIGAAIGAAFGGAISGIASVAGLGFIDCGAFLDLKGYFFPAPSTASIVNGAADNIIAAINAH